MNDPHDYPIRAAVYTDLAHAEKAIDSLLAAGYTAEEISVVTSDETMKQYFSRFQHEDPAGEHTEEGMAAGTAAGMAVGAFAALGLATATGVGLVIAGAAMTAGAAVGSFAGAMSTRGVEGEMADFYDQSLSGGDVLVGVTIPQSSDNATARLAEAERILGEAGAKPIRLDRT